MSRLVDLAELEELKEERDRYRERLQFDPGGSDKIDELEMALEFARAEREAKTRLEAAWRGALEALSSAQHRARTLENERDNLLRRFNVLKDSLGRLAAEYQPAVTETALGPKRGMSL